MSETTRNKSIFSRLGRWLAELILVFVGVYAAFWLNNYQQHQQEAKRRDQIERAHLNATRLSFKHDPFLGKTGCQVIESLGRRASIRVRGCIACSICSGREVST